MELLQIIIATSMGVMVLLWACSWPTYRPLTDDAINRLMLSAAITLIVMCCPMCATDVIGYAIMLMVGTVGMFGMTCVIFGLPPFDYRLAPEIITARRGSGYRRMNHQLQAI